MVPDFSFLRSCYDGCCVLRNYLAEILIFECSYQAEQDKLVVIETDVIYWALSVECGRRAAKPSAL